MEFLRVKQGCYPDASDFFNQLKTLSGTWQNHTQQESVANLSQVLLEPDFEL